MKSVQHFPLSDFSPIQVKGSGEMFMYVVRFQTDSGSHADAESKDSIFKMSRCATSRFANSGAGAFSPALA